MLQPKIVMISDSFSNVPFIKRTPIVCRKLDDTGLKKQFENAAEMFYNIAMVITDKSLPLLPLLPLDIQSFPKIKKDDFQLSITKGNHKAKFRFLIENLAKREKKPVGSAKPHLSTEEASL